MRRLNLFLTLVALSLATTTLWAKPAAADANGKLPGAFSVSSTNVVYFSQGNLQYIGTAATPYWKFAEEQYEYFGETTGQNNGNQNVDRDFFASGSKNDPWYSGASNRSWTEWGVNAISNGGNTANFGWRTLTMSEWNYLAYSRSASTINGTANAKFAKACLLGTIHGIIFFPDSYTHPDGVALPTGINQIDQTSWNGNQYSAEDWAKMEAAGCVFLPAAGYRCANVNSPSTYHYSAIGTEGRYWGTNNNHALIVYSSNMQMHTSLPTGTYAYHLAVRLVSNTPPIPKATISSTPSAVGGLIYTGSGQELVSEGVADGGTIKYSLDGTNWSEDIPTGTNPGDYTVYYMVEGDASHSNYIPSPNTINVTIAKGDLPGVVLPEATSTIDYDGTEKTLLEIDPVAGATIWYKLGDGEWTTELPKATDADSYSVQYQIVPDNPNYKTYGPNTVTVTIFDYPTVKDDEDPSTVLAELYNGGSPALTDLKVKRRLWADGEYNTICLPFNVTNLATSPLAGYERLKAFKGATVTGSGQDLYIDIFVEDATEIVAGVPYLITYPADREGGDIENPVFHNITVTRTTPLNVSANGVTFQGMFAQVHIDPYTSSAREQDYLFLGANSQLMWPSSTQTSSDIKMRGFRAYFIIDRNVITPAHAPKGTRARIMDAPKTTTGMDELNATICTKFIENGQLYIIKNGVKYNAQGIIVK